MYNANLGLLLEESMSRHGGNLHISLDLGECDNVALLESRSRGITRKILRIARKAGCTIRKRFRDPYKPEEGYTLVVTIAESHFAISTWPEERFVNVDIFLCNFTRNNMAIARRLEKALVAFFGAREVRRWAKLRGPVKI